ncbi:hypothetical protein GGR92_001782 [Spirosoma lacussanchae]
MTLFDCVNDVWARLLSFFLLIYSATITYSNVSITFNVSSAFCLIYFSVYRNKYPIAPLGLTNP